MGKGDSMIKVPDGKIVIPDEKPPSGEVTPPSLASSYGSNVVLIKAEPEPKKSEGHHIRAYLRRDNHLCLRRVLGVTSLLALMASVILGIVVLISHFSVLSSSGNLSILRQRVEAKMADKPTKIQHALRQNKPATPLPGKYYLTLPRRTQITQHGVPNLDKMSLLKSKDQCVHWRLDSFKELKELVMHDTKTQWSALIRPATKRCLMFTPMSWGLPSCPKTYPWKLDSRMGLLSCRLTRSPIRAVVRRVTRLIKATPMKNITNSGDKISTLCANYTSYRVLAVFVSYTTRPGLRHVRNANHPGFELARNAKKDGELRMPETFVYTEDGQVPEVDGEETGTEVVDFDADDKDQVRKFEMMLRKKETVGRLHDLIIE